MDKVRLVVPFGRGLRRCILERINLMKRYRCVQPIGRKLLRRHRNQGAIHTSSGGKNGKKATKKGAKTVNESTSRKKPNGSSIRASKKGRMQMITIPDNDENVFFDDKVPDAPSFVELSSGWRR